MGKLSDIYSSYKKSLDVAQDEYEESVRRGSNNAKRFYDDFFRDLTVNLGSRLTDREFREDVIEHVERFFGKRELNFIAVDGSCDKHSSGEFVSFYGGAYGAKGVLRLSGTDAVVEYKRWELEKDVSMVAFIPVPYSRITEVGTDVEDFNTFAVSELEKVELTSMHMPMMQLAEVFLAYNSATSSNLDSPDIILIDNTLSGMLGYTDFSPDKVNMVGHVLADGRRLEKHDVAIAQAHPFSDKMGIPSTKTFSMRFAITKFLHDNPSVSEIGMTDLAGKLNVRDLTTPLKRLAEYGIVEVDWKNDTVKKGVDPYRSWEHTKSMFQGICKSIFLDKRENALRYEIEEDDGQTGSRWMSTDDVRFLIAIGLRALIEECWNRKILLVGIVKDSASAYLTKNYLGVARHFGSYPQLAGRRYGPLPPTDRAFCELLPYLDDGLKSPWGTIEFDSTFMTLRIDDLGKGNERFGGTFGGITRPERLFLRSIAQFYVRSGTESPLTGHAIFVDRLTFDELDGTAEEIPISDPQIGSMSPLFYPTAASPNTGQLITYFLLDTLTKNHFAEMIGYPDPLHKADQGAKSMRDSVKRLLTSSEIKFRSRPLINTLREIRKGFGR